MRSKIIYIPVTQEDINKGIPCRYRECALSLAARRHFKKRKDSIGSCGDEIDCNGFEYRSVEKNRIRNFIDTFDTNKRKCRPFVLKVRRV